MRLLQTCFPIASAERVLICRCVRCGARGSLPDCQPERCDGRRLLDTGNLRRNASAETFEPEQRPFFRSCGQTASGSGHLPDQPGDGRIFHRKRNSGALHAPHSGIIVGNLPLNRPGEGLGNLIFGNAHPAWLKAVDHNFEPGYLGREELRDHAIRVAQSGDAGLDHQIDGRSVLEKRCARQVESGAHIHDDVVKVLARYRDQPVDRVMGGIKLGELAWSCEHRHPRAMLD